MIFKMNTEQELKDKHSGLREALSAFISAIELSDRQEQAQATFEGRPSRHHEGSLRKAKDALKAYS